MLRNGPADGTAVRGDYAGLPNWRESATAARRGAGLKPCANRPAAIRPPDGVDWCARLERFRDGGAGRYNRVEVLMFATI
jgi:hypothetical protein